jgi:hypothetical protein
MKSVLLFLFFLSVVPTSFALTYQIEGNVDLFTIQPVLDQSFPENYFDDYVMDSTDGEADRSPAILGPATANPVGANADLYQTLGLRAHEIITVPETGTE